MGLNDNIKQVVLASKIATLVLNCIDRHIKIFLSFCHKFCHAYYSDGVTQFWTTTVNVPSLLNLAEQVRNHGKLRCYWDGRRERYIQLAKNIKRQLD